MAHCARCGGELAERFRFCPWCAEPQRKKIVEFFSPHPRDAGKALRVTHYLTDDPHIRFSVWNESGVAECAGGTRGRFLRASKRSSGQARSTFSAASTSDALRRRRLCST
jgi:hypothetical protein